MPGVSPPTSAPAAIAVAGATGEPPPKARGERERDFERFSSPKIAVTWLHGLWLQLCRGQLLVFKLVLRIIGVTHVQERCLKIFWLI